MKTFYRIACRNRQGQVTQMDELLDRGTVARLVRELNERCSHKKIEYFAESIELITLPCWLLTNLFQEGKITYEELLEFTGSRVAERAIDLKKYVPHGSSSCKGGHPFSKYLRDQNIDDR